MTDCPIEEAAKVKKRGKAGGIIFFSIILVLFICSVILLVYSSGNPDFAQRYADNESYFFRRVLAFISRIFPFSLAEFLVISGIVSIIALGIRAAVLRFYYKEKGRLAGYLQKLFGLVLILAIIFINSFGICYYRYPLSMMLGINTEDITETDIFSSAYICSAVASDMSRNIKTYGHGESYMDYGFEEMVDKIHVGYKNIFSDVPEHISVKPVALSEVWSYTHISGMYFPFTGESNVNVDFPDFIVAFSTAHEIAHQLGYADEADANMLAYLALAYSEDDYLVYAAHVNALDYLLAELSPESADLILRSTDRCVINDLSEYYRFLAEHTDKSITGLSFMINDAYLKANGQEQGVKSYGEVALLLTGFMKEVYYDMF